MAYGLPHHTRRGQGRMGIRIPEVTHPLPGLQFHSFLFWSCLLSGSLLIVAASRAISSIANKQMKSRHRAPKKGKDFSYIMYMQR